MSSTDDLSPTPVPKRITFALDYRGLYGPEVDLAVGTFEGNPAGDVDRWEDPDDPALPTAEQVELLAELTHFPVKFFYIRWDPPPGLVWICDRTRRHGNQCKAVDNRTGEQVYPPPDAGAKPKPRKRSPARVSPEPADPPAAGRLDPTERANLLARIEEARRNVRGR